MPNLATLDPRVIYALFKGDPGTRKSTCALSFSGKQFWFDWDRKMQGLIIPSRKWNIDLTKIDYESYDDWDKPRQKLEKFVIDCPYDNLICDSVTSMVDMTLRQTLKLKRGEVRSSGKAAGKVIANIPVNELEDYNAESSAVNELIALTKDIQEYNYRKGRIINIILIAHVMEITKKEGENQVITRTIVTAGKRVAAKVPAYCSEVWHFYKKAEFDANKEGQYAFMTSGDNMDFARTALPLSKEIIFNDKPVYETYVIPAIKQLELQPKPVTEFPTQTTTNKSFGV